MIKEIIEDNIVILTLSHGATNSITLDTVKAIDKAVNRVNSEDALKGIILTGEGRFFSSGFHLPDFIGFKSVDEIDKWFTQEEELLINYFTCEKPVICAMNGHSAAAGLIWAFASDYRLVTNHPKIKLGMSENKIGLPLSVAQSAAVRYGLNSDRAFRDVMFFGDMVGVEKALEIGIVDEIVEEDQLLVRAKEIIVTWIDNPNRPFIPMKQMAKEKTVKEIRESLKDATWKERLKCFLRDDVKKTLQFVQSSMPS